MVAIYTYGFDTSVNNFKKDLVKLETLCDYSRLLEKALEIDYIKEEYLETLTEWNKDPENWG